MKQIVTLRISQRYIDMCDKAKEHFRFTPLYTYGGFNDIVVVKGYNNSLPFYLGNAFLDPIQCSDGTAEIGPEFVTGGWNEKERIIIWTFEQLIETLPDIFSNRNMIALLSKLEDFAVKQETLNKTKDIKELLLCVRMYEEFGMVWLEKRRDWTTSLDRVKELELTRRKRAERGA